MILVASGKAAWQMAYAAGGYIDNETYLELCDKGINIHDVIMNNEFYTQIYMLNWRKELVKDKFLQFKWKNCYYLEKMI